MRQHKTILVTATMSAGKSTLINALVGHRIMMTQNESCTSTPWVITEHADATEPYTIHNKLRFKFKSNMAETLHHLKEPMLRLFTPMYRLHKTSVWTLIDTPGVNSAIDHSHRGVTESFLKSANYDVLLYVLNGSHLGTADDRAHLTFIKQYMSCQNVIFVLNKVDQFRKGQDSIEESVSRMKSQLEAIGFVNPVIQPISAHAGYLFKKEAQGLALSEEEMDELVFYHKKFKQPWFDLSTRTTTGSRQPLYQCGLFELEELIN